MKTRHLKKMKNHSLNFKIWHLTLSFLIFIFAFYILSATAYAAELFFISDQKQISAGQQFNVAVKLNPGTENINALEGIIATSKNLKILKVVDGNSLVGLWVKKPVISDSGGVFFSGIFPGGYQGDFGAAWAGAKPGEVFSTVILAQSEGAGEIYFENGRAFLNDGLGTEAPLSLKGLTLSVGGPSVSGGDNLILDSTSPEHFTPEVFSYKNIFENKWALIFFAKDKGLGIDHFEVMEKRPESIINLFKTPVWQIAESPYLLKDQALKSEISVKAVDKAGNETVEKIPPRNKISWYEKYQFWSIIIIVGSVLYLIFSKKRWIQNFRQ